MRHTGLAGREWGLDRDPEVYREQDASTSQAAPWLGVTSRKIYFSWERGFGFRSRPGGAARPADAVGRERGLCWDLRAHGEPDASCSYAAPCAGDN